MESHLSRRTALLAIGGATAVAAIPVAAPASSANVDRTAWSRAFAVMERAKAAFETESGRFAPIEAAYEKAAEAVPHVTLRPDPYSGRKQPVTTDDMDFVRTAQRLVHDVAEGRCRLETEKYQSLKDHFALCQDVAAAVDRRTAQIESIDQQLGYSTAYERYERAQEALATAECDLIMIPAPDGPDLLWKLENLWLGDEGSAWAEELVTQILADGRRLLSSGRA